jgi:protocatechuate 3,4-dioxygenase beta subunit
MTMTNEQIDRLLPATIDRRRLLRLGITAVPVAVLAAACGSDSSVRSGSDGTRGSGTTSGTANRTLTPTPSCDDGDDPTPSLTEGPFFSSGSPERTNITDGADGTTLVLTGTVLGTDCTALAGAKLDFWQADGDGEYDNRGYRLRGHQFTDDTGAYRLETIVPANYQGRTRHLHVKVQPSGGSVLTTQLYWPDEPANASDDLFDDACVMNVSSVGDGQAATFNFVVEA